MKKADSWILLWFLYAVIVNRIMEMADGVGFELFIACAASFLLGLNAGMRL